MGRQHHKIIGNWVLHNLFQKEKGGFWYARYRHLHSNKLRYRSTKERVKSKAERKAILFIQDLSPKNPTGISFADAFRRFLDLKSIRETTKKDLEYTFNGVYLRYFGDYCVDEISLDTIEDFLKDLEEKGRTPRTRSKHLINSQKFLQLVYPT